MIIKKLSLLFAFFSIAIFAGYANPAYKEAELSLKTADKNILTNYLKVLKNNATGLAMDEALMNFYTTQLSDSSSIGGVVVNYQNRLYIISSYFSVMFAPTVTVHLKNWRGRTEIYYDQPVVYRSMTDALVLVALEAVNAEDYLLEEITSSIEWQIEPQINERLDYYYQSYGADKVKLSLKEASETLQFLNFTFKSSSFQLKKPGSFHNALVEGSDDLFYGLGFLAPAKTLDRSLNLLYDKQKRGFLISYKTVKAFLTKAVAQPETEEKTTSEALLEKSGQFINFISQNSNQQKLTSDYLDPQFINAYGLEIFRYLLENESYLVALRRESKTNSDLLTKSIELSNLFADYSSMRSLMSYDENKLEAIIAYYNQDRSSIRTLTWHFVAKKGWQIVDFDGLLGQTLPADEELLMFDESSNTSAKNRTFNIAFRLASGQDVDKDSLVNGNFAIALYFTRVVSLEGELGLRTFYENSNHADGLNYLGSLQANLRLHIPIVIAGKVYLEPNFAGFIGNSSFFVDQSKTSDSRFRSEGLLYGAALGLDLGLHAKPRILLSSELGYRVTTLKTSNMADRKGLYYNIGLKFKVF